MVEIEDDIVVVHFVHLNLDRLAVRPLADEHLTGAAGLLGNLLDSNHSFVLPHRAGYANS